MQTFAARRNGPSSEGGLPGSVIAGMPRAHQTERHSPGYLRASTGMRINSTSQADPASSTSDSTRPNAPHHFAGIPTFSPFPLQAKLKIGRQNDRFEREADRVMNLPEMSRGSDSGGATQSFSERGISGAAPVGTLQAYSESGGGSTHVPPAVGRNIEGLRGGGRPLPESSRAFFEPRFGRDLSDVRVHTDEGAASTAKAINARAFTVGRDVVFGGGEYAPESTEGRRLLAHELTHVVQQSGGTSGPDAGTVQRTVSGDIRTEAGLPSSQQTPGRLGQLETQARGEADQMFQQQTGGAALVSGTTGRATQIINHLAGQVAQLENARARGYQQAVSAMLSQQTLNSTQAGAFWRAFAGNTLWALSGLVPLLGPVVGVSRIALAAGGGVLLRTNAIGRFLQAGGGALASTTVGLAGAELAQFSGGLPSGSSLPSSMQAIQTEFTNINSRVMSRYRSEAFALTLDFLNGFGSFIDPLNQTPVTPDYLESLATGAIAETLFADLQAQGILNQSNYTINTGQAQTAAKNDLLQAFILRFGTVRDVSFQTSRDEIGDRLGADGTSAALTALGGESAFAGRLQGDHELVLGNVNGTLADWGSTNTMSAQSQQSWSSGTTLSSGSHSVPFDIEDKNTFASKLDGRGYDPLTRGVSTIRSLSGRGARWSPSVLPSSGTASFSSSDYRSLTVGSRTIFGLQKLTLEFAPSGSFTSGALSERSTIEPSTRGQRAVFSFSGNPEQVLVDISLEAPW